MLNIRKKYGNAGKFQQTEEAAILIDLGCWTKADAFATFPDVAEEGKNNQTLMSAAPCQKASQSQERQRGYRRFRNLADGKGMNSHGTAIASRAGPAPQGQPVQVEN